MLTAIAGPLIKIIGGQLLDRIDGALAMYFKREITREELAAKISEALLATFADVEKAYAQALTEGFKTFMEAAKQSRLMQAVWAAVALSQLFVIFWYQWIVPAMTTWHWFGLSLKTPFASPGATIDWAYALLLFCLGGGALALKSGPGSGTLKDQLKSLVGR